MNPFFRVLVNLVNLFIPQGPYGDKFRGITYKFFLKSCGKNFKIASQAFIYNPKKLIVGDNVYIGFGSYIGEGEVVLEDEVLIGNHVSITASDHLKNENSYRFGGFAANKIVIKKGSWIAAHSCVTSGVTIGEGALVSAGSVVTKDIENRNVVGGVPARRIK